MTEIAAQNDCDREDEETHQAFLAECKRLGISSADADTARESTESFWTKWWGSFNDDASLGENGGAVGKHLEDHLSPTGGPSSAASNLPPSAAAALLPCAKREALSALSRSSGDATNLRFLTALSALSSIYRATAARSSGSDDEFATASDSFEGTWSTLSRPHFKECLGRNDCGDFMYTLGRMSFDMFRPSGLKCSIQRILNKSRIVGKDDNLPCDVPRGLREEVEAFGRSREERAEGNDCNEEEKKAVLRTYDIEVHFTIEPRPKTDADSEQEDKPCSNNSAHLSSSEGREASSCRTPSKPIRSIMTTFGYVLPDPNTRGRYTVWFSGGVVAPIPETRGTNNKSRPKDTGLTNENSRSSSCSLPLHECRRWNKSCSLHGIKKLDKNKMRSMRKSASRYVRPSHGPCSNLSFAKRCGAMPCPYSAEWEDIFAPEDNWKRSLGEKAKVLAAKAFLGAEVPTRMEDDGTISFTLHRPIGGHGFSYVDVLYVDNDLRITQGNYGSVLVQVRGDIDLFLQRYRCQPSQSASSSLSTKKINFSSREGHSFNDGIDRRQRVTSLRRARPGGKAVAA